MSELILPFTSWVPDFDSMFAYMWSIFHALPPTETMTNVGSILPTINKKVNITY